MIEALVTNYVKTLIFTNILRTLDKALSLNAESAEDAGLTVLVTRTYDGVGLDGNRECKFCTDRECVDKPYDEAKSEGIFDRHEGCGCIIEYVSKTGKRTRATNATDWIEV